MTVVNPKWVLAFASIAIVLLGANVTPAADTGFVDRVYHDDDGEHKYVVFVPDSYLSLIHI